MTMREDRKAARDGVIPGLSELMAVYRASQEAWRKEAEDVTKLGDELLDVMEGEPTRIVAAATENVDRILRTAFQELDELEARIQAIRQLTPAADSRPTSSGEFGRVPSEAPPGGDRAGVSRRRSALDSQRRGPRLEAKPVGAELGNALGDVPADRQREAPSLTSESLFALDDRASSAPRPRYALLLGVGAVALAGLTAVTLIAVNLHTAQPAAVRSGSSSQPTMAERPQPNAATLPENNSSSRRAAATARTPAAVWVLAEARRPVWVKTTIDGGTPENRLFKAGETRRFLAAREVSMTLADAGALFVSVNSGNSTALGRSGQGVTRVFTADEFEDRRGRSAATQPPRNDGSATTLLRPDSAAADTSAAANDARSDIEALNRRWFDGYHHGDNNAMAYVAAPDLAVSDERAATQRPPLLLASVRRSFDRVQFDRRGDTAVFAARMVEDCDIGDAVVRHVSVVAETWRRAADSRWRLTTVRMVHEDR